MKQLPQHLLAKLLMRIWKPIGYSFFDGIKIFWIEKPGIGLSLGEYIFLDHQSDKDGMKHEYGHTLQSRKYGWAYLLIVGVPSVLGNIYDRIFHRTWMLDKRTKWYYSRWPEKQADMLGGVKRWK
jgi:hypothetical protein